MIKKFSAGLVVLAVFLAPAIATAHVSVKPTQVKPGEFTTFNVSVPNEKKINVINVKLELPAGVKNVKPTVKTGWTVTVSDSSITWSDGAIATGFRDDFTFSAQAPEKAGDLIWKSFETHSDGSVSNWNQSPDKEEVEGSNSGPYSVTKVAEVKADTANVANTVEGKSSNTLPVVLSLLALTLSVASLLFKKRA